MSKKQLDTGSIANELTGASIYFRKPRSQPKARKPPIKNRPKNKKRQKNEISQSTNRSTNQSTSQSTDQLTNKFSAIDEIGEIVARPKAFYITERLDKRLNDAVNYLQEKGIHKVDRSVLLNAMLHNPDLFTPKQLDSLREPILLHLANKSLKRG